MEKRTFRLSWQEIIKYAIMLIALGSAYASLVAKNQEQDKQIQDLKDENKKLQNVAEKVAEINGKQDIIIKYVEAINHRLDADN